MASDPKNPPVPFDLAELRRLEEKATRGTWEVIVLGRSSQLWISTEEEKANRICQERYADILNDGRDDDRRINNLVFIASLRNSAPALLDRIEAQEKEIERLRAELEQALEQVEYLKRIVGDAKCPKHDNLYVARCLKCEKGQ